ncbi:pirin family protein [Plasticicumulans acidivorans]|uniref:Pirin n=1 Tax=Plasticicumulans acidivorans TaxID=886464 RepID=A0A317N1H1_9GAMM|nr:pirin family protein [Plasticicumulans acidivorans]PWV63133.1 hypothetical protein C7443_10357 [Plasticicumulans acidivorans]
MSNLQHDCAASLSSDCERVLRTSPAQRITTHDAELGEGMMIRRALPSRQRRMVGAWCFLDHFGPVDVGTGDGLRVGPHPHIGLQTVTWPLAGEILHRDSLGCEQLIRPGELNLMTAGCGIAHSEESPAVRSPLLHGAQLWIALPEAERRREPSFVHHPQLPRLTLGDARLTLLAGEFGGERSPAQVYSPLLGLDVACAAGGTACLPLRADFEHGALVLEGEVELEGTALGIGTFLYLPPGRDRLELRSRGPLRLLLLGGEPFAETILMWWNFVARTPQEIVEAGNDWNAGRHFGEVHGYPGARLVAPATPWGAAG